MPLLKVRSHSHLKHARRAGISFSPVETIVDVTDEQAAAIKGDTESLIAVEVSAAEAKAFADTKAIASSDPASIAAENVKLRSDVADLSQRVADLEAALRGDFGAGDEPRGVKPSIAPGAKGKARSDG